MSKNKNLSPKRDLDSGFNTSPSNDPFTGGPVMEPSATTQTLPQPPSAESLRAFNKQRRRQIGINLLSSLGYLIGTHGVTAVAVLWAISTVLAFPVFSVMNILALTAATVTMRLFWQ